MTPQKSREIFIESQFTADEILDLQKRGLYQDYVEGRISINAIYSQLKEQGIWGSVIRPCALLKNNV